jgi:uncharacterized protein (DUF2236 family)
MKDHGYFGPGSATWKIASEVVINLGGARAVLMQIAHPLVAMGVSEHSSYVTDPFGRTEHTFMLGQMLTFGSIATARDAARTINRLHTHVHGKLPDAAGTYSSGTPYRASDPELLLWVFATLIDTILYTYPIFIGPLSLQEQEQYYQESKTLGHLLGLSHADMPSNVQDLCQYVSEMVHSGRLAATPQSRQLARHVLFPRTPAFLRPLLHMNAQVTSALLPQPIREIYGIEWSPRQQRAFELSMRGLRTVTPRLPLSLRILPITQQLMRQGALSEQKSG